MHKSLPQTPDTTRYRPRIRTLCRSCTKKGKLSHLPVSTTGISTLTHNWEVTGRQQEYVESGIEGTYRRGLTHTREAKDVQMRRRNAKSMELRNTEAWNMGTRESHSFQQASSQEKHHLQILVNLFFPPACPERKIAKRRSSSKGDLPSPARHRSVHEVPKCYI